MRQNLPSAVPSPATATLLRATSSAAVLTGAAISLQIVLLGALWGAGNSVILALFTFVVGVGVSFLFWLPGIGLSLLIGMSPPLARLRAHPAFWPLWVGFTALVLTFFLSQSRFFPGATVVSLLPVLSDGTAVRSVPTFLWHAAVAGLLCGVIGLRAGVIIRSAMDAPDTAL